jgi:succinyl-CoA synthetase beta subunit
MASIRNRNGKWQARITRKGKWQARITRKGEQPLAKSFQSKQDAEKWARQLESEMDKGSYTNLVLAERTTFGEVIECYIQEVINKGPWL